MFLFCWSCESFSLDLSSNNWLSLCALYIIVLAFAQVCSLPFCSIFLPVESVVCFSGGILSFFRFEVRCGDSVVALLCLWWSFKTSFPSRQRSTAVLGCPLRAPTVSVRFGEISVTAPPGASLSWNGPPTFGRTWFLIWPLHYVENPQTPWALWSLYPTVSVCHIRFTQRWLKFSRQNLVCEVCASVCMHRVA